MACATRYFWGRTGREHDGLGVVAPTSNPPAQGCTSLPSDDIGQTVDTLKRLV